MMWMGNPCSRLRKELLFSGCHLAEALALAHPPKLGSEEPCHWSRCISRSFVLGLRVMSAKHLKDPHCRGLIVSIEETKLKVGLVHCVQLRRSIA
eukprot:g17449.t1